MENLFIPTHLNIKDKYRNLEVETSGKVKSTKYFPVYLIDNEEYIFKPLSKTKPLTTPMFAMSEVYWSYLINHYFDKRTPIYKLAYCHGLGEEQAKYYDYGTLVKSTIRQNQKLVNLLEYFKENPEPNIDINNYINYCMQTYNYANILKSDFLTKYQKLGRDIAWQVLLSILRKDFNFHYENVNFIIEKNKIIDSNPPIDFEFSQMFLYPDNLKSKEYYDIIWEKSYHMMTTVEQMLIEGIGPKEKFQDKNILNICTIVSLYPNLVTEFINRLEAFRNGVSTLKINDHDNYIIACNSESWKIGHARYKNHQEQMASRLEKEILPIEINKEELFQKIKEETIQNSYNLENILRIYLHAYNCGIADLENLTKEEIEELLNNNSQNKELIKALKKF